MAFWRRIWQRDGEDALAACTALDVGTEFAKALGHEEKWKLHNECK